MPVTTSNSASRRASIYLATGGGLIDNANHHSSSPSIAGPSTPLSNGYSSSPLISNKSPGDLSLSTGTLRRNSVYVSSPTTVSAAPPPIPPQPLPLPSTPEVSTATKSTTTPWLNGTGLLATNYGFQTIEQMLNNQNQLPILLYIRNYNEYRRHRPAEARLAARRQARAEAREIRLREMERQQKELDAEQQHDRHESSSIYTSTPVANHVNHDHVPIRSRVAPILARESRSSFYTNSRRSSQESLDTCADSPREIRYYLHDLEEKFRKAMISNAQMDNEKQAFVYQIDSFKDDMEEMEENYLRLQRDFKEKSRNLEQLKRDNERLQFDFKCYKDALEERERLIRDAGLVIIRNNNGNNNVTSKLCNKNQLLNGMVNGNNNEMAKMVNGEMNDEDHDEDCDDDMPVLLANNISLISKDAALMLEDVPGKTLEAKLTAMMMEKKKLQNMIAELKNDLDDERNRLNSLNNSLTINSLHLTTEMQTEIQREANKITNDLRYKLKKSEQENATLSSTVSRLETQVARFKTAADSAERLQEELKLDKRKAQRELREALTKIEELESANAHLQKRIDKLKSNRNILGILSSQNSTGSNPNTPPADTVPNSTLIASQQQPHPMPHSPPPSSNASEVSTICSTSTE